MANKETTITRGPSNSVHDLKNMIAKLEIASFEPNEDALKLPIGRGREDILVVCIVLVLVQK